MTSTTYRPRASGPGWTAEEIRSRLLFIARGDVSLALNLACHDLSETTKGGMYRPQPMSGKAVVNPDDGEPVT